MREGVTEERKRGDCDRRRRRRRRAQHAREIWHAVERGLGGGVQSVDSPIARSNNARASSGATNTLPEPCRYA